MNDYGERIDFCPEPFRLDMLDHRSHPRGQCHWRLSIGELVIGYTKTHHPSTSVAEVIAQLFEERAKTSAAWTSEPDALVRNRYGSLQAMFAYARDAEEFVETKNAELSNYLHMETLSGRQIVGTTGHGHRILEKLRDQGRL